MNKQLVALVVFAACFSFTENNAAHAFLPFDIIRESTFVGGEVTSAIGQIIGVVTTAERNIRGNLTIFVRDVFLGQMDNAFKAMQGAITTINTLQTTGLKTINSTLDNLNGGIKTFASRLTGGALNLGSSVTTPKATVSTT